MKNIDCLYMFVRKIIKMHFLVKFIKNSNEKIPVYNVLFFL